MSCHACQLGNKTTQWTTIICSNNEMSRVCVYGCASVSVCVCLCLFINESTLLTRSFTLARISSPLNKHSHQMGLAKQHHTRWRGPKTSRKPTSTLVKWAETHYIVQTMRRSLYYLWHYYLHIYSGIAPPLLEMTLKHHSLTHTNASSAISIYSKNLHIDSISGKFRSFVWYGFQRDEKKSAKISNCKMHLRLSFLSK